MGIKRTEYDRIKSTNKIPFETLLNLGILATNIEWIFLRLQKSKKHIFPNIFTKKFGKSNSGRNNKLNMKKK